MRMGWQESRPRARHRQRIPAHGCSPLRRGNGHHGRVDILYLLVPLSVVLAIAIGAAFWWAVRNDQYEHGGIRSVEIGSLMFGKYAQDGTLIPAQMELVRLAIPRRVYTQSHIDYVSEVIIEVYNKRHEIGGLKIIEEAPLLRHFTAKLAPIN